MNVCVTRFNLYVCFAITLNVSVQFFTSLQAKSIINCWFTNPAFLTSADLSGWERDKQLVCIENKTMNTENIVTLVDSEAGIGQIEITE